MIQEDATRRDEGISKLDLILKNLMAFPLITALPDHPRTTISKGFQIR